MTRLADALPRMLAGDLLFVAGRAPFSRLIEWWTGQRWSHVAAVVWVRLAGWPQRVPCVLESMEGYGVRAMPLAPYLEARAKAGEAVCWRPLCENSAISRPKLLGHLAGAWGEAYSPPWQFIWSFGRISRWVQRRLGLRPELDPRRPFCSWLITAALLSAGWQPPAELPDPADVTPGDVFAFTCLAAGEEIEP